MRHLRKWGLPVLTGLAVLAAVLLPRQISALRDRQTLGSIHTVPLAEEALTVREISLPEKLELLGRVILYPNLEIFSTTQSLPSPGDPASEQMSEQASEAFFKSVGYLADWDILPESFDLDPLEFQGGSRAVYVRADGYQSVSMLYLQGATDQRDSFWIVVDEESGLPVWIDCSLRSVPAKGLLSGEELGRRFLDGLGLEAQQRGPNAWEISGAGGLVYNAYVQSIYGRICVEPLGFARELFGEDPTSSPGAPLAEN